MERFLYINPYVHAAVFITCIVLQMQLDRESAGLIFLLLLIPNLIAGAWYLAVYAFLVKELGRKKSELWLAGLMVFIPAFVIILACYLTAFHLHGDPSDYAIIDDTDPRPVRESIRALRNTGLLMLLPLVIMLVIRTRQYLYARSIGFIIMETVVPLMGMITLTPALLQEKKERAGTP